MSNATITAPAPAAVAVEVEAIPTPEVLAAAVAAVSVAGDADSTAKATLAAVVLARYKHRMTRHVRMVDGVEVLPDNMRNEVSHLIWLDATGTLTPVAQKLRTPGEKSLGQYLSRYGTVASDLILGTEALEDVATANAAYTSINDSKRAAKANAEAAEAALLDMKSGEAFAQWLDTQKAEVKTAFKLVTSALRSESGKSHVGAFVATVTPVAPATK